MDNLLCNKNENKLLYKAGDESNLIGRGGGDNGLLYERNEDKLLHKVDENKLLGRDNEEEHLYDTGDKVEMFKYF